MKKTELFNRAIDPHQYDGKSLDWKSESSTLSPTRKFAWEYISQHKDLFAGKRILDIGAGTGWLISELRKLPIASISATEPSKANYELLKAQFPDAEIYNNSLDSFHSNEQFDVITLIWVTAHVSDINHAFQKLSSHLIEGGYLVVVSGDYDYANHPDRQGVIAIEQVDPGTVVSLSARAQGEMADIYRKTDVYVAAAKNAGMDLATLVPMKPTQSLIEAYPRYEKFKDLANSNLLIFKKSS